MLNNYKGAQSRQALQDFLETQCRTAEAYAHHTANIAQGAEQAGLAAKELMQEWLRIWQMGQGAPLEQLGLGGTISRRLRENGLETVSDVLAFWTMETPALKNGLIPSGQSKVPYALRRFAKARADFRSA